MKQLNMLMTNVLLPTVSRFIGQGNGRETALRKAKEEFGEGIPRRTENLACARAGEKKLLWNYMRGILRN